MSYDCSCDYDPPEFITILSRKARKIHHCYECSGEIRPGEVHEYVSGKWYGDLNWFRTCERCRDIRKWVHNNIPCFCWAYGNLDEDAGHAVEEACFRAPLETAGLRFGFLRRKVLRDRFNQRRTAA